MLWLCCLLPALTAQAANPFLPQKPSAPAIKSPFIKSPSLSKALAPRITRVIAPTCVKAGSAITVLGSNFGTRRRLLLVLGNSTRLQVRYWRNTRISAVVPASRELRPGRYLGISLYTDPFITRRYSRLVTATQRVRVCNRASIPSIRPSLKPGLLTKPGTPGRPLPGPRLPKPPILGAPPKPKPPVPGAPPTPRPPATTTASGSSDSGETGGSGTSDDDSGDGGDDDFGDDGGDGASERQRPDSSGSLTDTELPSAPGSEDGEEDDGQPKPPVNAETGELLVISRDMNAARTLADELEGEGYGVKRRQRLAGLNLVVTVFRPPEGTGLQQALGDLRQRFPKLWMSYNHRWQSRPVKPPAGNGKPGCATGLRIGVIGGRIKSTNGITVHSLLPIGVTAARDLTTRRLATGLARRLPGARIDLAVILRSGQGATAESVLRALDWLGKRKVRHIWLPLSGPRNLAVQAAIVRLRSRGIGIHQNGGLPAKLKTRCPAGN